MTPSSIVLFQMVVVCVAVLIAIIIGWCYVHWIMDRTEEPEGKLSGASWLITLYGPRGPAK